MPRRPLPQRSRHRGFALMALLVLLTLGGLYFFVNNLTPAAVAERRQQQTSAALNQARDALLGYALKYREDQIAQQQLGLRIQRTDDGDQIGAKLVPAGVHGREGAGTRVHLVE